ncbi:hypothetical protein NEF87_003226 [Candidatus Lokiarchaeum ossiferum]|uniref:Uncharacterized protein n=1 Tax=Candidatus Lokiarchaeum ossiferum TaxID=2951803 RepID=A0ABY6HU47_9ARCH|nr:hypothetical protein NEF87_003226 [Candidatus Lokiarchaeum sp. B-35]
MFLQGYGNNKKTRVYDVIKDYGDIAGVMKIFGVKSVDLLYSQDNHSIYRC